tara:strand:- start:1103 stop:1540 length:438 start_codon:yes stop_codon:yes gene_type:complete
MKSWLSKLALLSITFAPQVRAEKIVPNFQQGILNNHTETKTVLKRDMTIYEWNTGYSLTVGGANVKPSTNNIAPSGFVKTAGTVSGVATTYVMPDLSTKPQYSIVNEGAAFSYYETLETPGIKSMTKIIEEQTIESVSDSTSTFQ